MKSVLLSIKPQFVKEIKAGTKTFEFRKCIYKDTNIKKILIYSSFPEQKVVAFCDVENILVNTPSQIWHDTKHSSGITKAFFDKYFLGKNIAYAIKICNIHFFDKPKMLIDFGVKKAPQSFMYVDLSGIVLCI